MESDISRRMAQFPLFFSLRAPSFSRSDFRILLVLRISCKWWEIEQTLLFPLDRKSCVCHQMAPLPCCTSMHRCHVVHHGPDLHFQRHKCWNVNILKNVRVSKNAQERLYRGWYFQSNETIVNVVLRELDLNFQCSGFQVAILARLNNIQTMTIAIR